MISHHTHPSQSILSDSNIAQQLKVLTTKPDKFNPWIPHSRKGETIPANCPLTFTHMLGHTCAQATPSKKMNEYNTVLQRDHSL